MANDSLRSAANRHTDKEIHKVCVSGYFDPLHVGHISYLKTAKSLGDVLIDKDPKQRCGPGTPLDERRVILESIRYVDEVFIGIDSDSCVAESLQHIRPAVFAKGMCASASEIAVCEREQIELVSGVGDNLHFHDLLAETR